MLNFTKQSTSIYVFLLFTGLLFYNCPSEDTPPENTTVKNHLKVDNTEYELSSGTLVYYGKSDEGYWNGNGAELILLSSGLSLKIVGDGGELSGNGHGIEFGLYSVTKKKLENRVYTFSKDDSAPIGTFDQGEWAINYNSNSEKSEKEGDINGGTIKVSLDGSEYTITFSCTDDNGKKVTGFYEGTLKLIDDSEN